MTTIDLGREWAERFGLALAPLFDASERPDGAHDVLLDGGYGSFALSVTDDQPWLDHRSSAWAWSSNLPHHVTVTPKAVAVTRWDSPRAEILSRTSVERQIDTFYEYLTADRVRSARRVVDHILSLFKRIRSLVADANLADTETTSVFLAFLERLISQESDNNGSGSKGVSPTEGQSLLGRLSRNGLKMLESEAFVGQSSTLTFQLFPSLAVRHAGSEIFQEAHFQLSHAPGLDLFDYPAPAVASPVSRGGAHFTPAPLARSVTEQALAQLENLASRTTLTVLDPACGSGAFLHEAMRALRRSDYKGHLILIGRDISPAAIAMANFVVAHATNDWIPAGGVETNLAVGDSLSEALPPADMVLMNPPFVSWPALSSAQRETMRSVLGDRLEGRGDLSMAFVTKALDAVAPGGALGVLLPSSLLTTQSAVAWRSSLTESTDLRFIAQLGDYGLFTYAMVQVSAAVFAKPSRTEKSLKETIAIVAADDPDATGNALRMLRRSTDTGLRESAGRSWQLFRVSSKELTDRPTWRPLPPNVESALARLRDAGLASLGELFDVRQGIRTGLNKAFLLSADQLAALPKQERRFFRSATMNDSVADGKIRSGTWIFYPYDHTGLILPTEVDVRQKVPTYFSLYLEPNRQQLLIRSSITRANREDWWGLSERRSWALSPKSRVISKYFGGPGSFALDLEASFVVVQGFAWFLKTSDDPKDDTTEIAESTLLSAYYTVLNSPKYCRLFELYSPHVAGGQFDLSPRYVNSIPMPNLRLLSEDEDRGGIVVKLAELGRDDGTRDDSWIAQADRLTAELFGGLLDQL